MELTPEQIALAKHLKKHGFSNDQWDTALRFMLVAAGLPESDLPLVKERMPKPDMKDLRRELRGYTVALPMSSTSGTSSVFTINLGNTGSNY